MGSYANRNAASYRIVRNDGAVIATFEHHVVALSLAEWLTRTAKDGATFSVVARG